MPGNFKKNNEDNQQIHMSRVENSLKELSREQLSMVIEGSFDGIYITDGEAVTILVNKSYETITGLNRDRMLGKNMRDLLRDKIISASGTLSCLESQKTVTLEQTFITGKKALITSRPVFDENGRVILVITNVRDITELNALKERLIKNEELTQKYLEEIEIIRSRLVTSDSIVAVDEKSLETLNVAKKLAGVDATVLIMGETGVGKEEIARFIHQNSDRANKNFIKVDCGAIPDNLMESELFGYEHGAFTGAKQDGKKGLFEIADGGSIFFDEIGELPLPMQVKLLRFLQEKEFKKVGGVKPVSVDVKIMSATNRDLEHMVKEGTFRRDLFYRINVAPLNIPSLRDRREDILPLAEVFLRKYNKKYGFSRYFSREALEAMYLYNWPGNIRELKNIVERLVIIMPEDMIDQSDLKLPVRERRQMKPQEYPDVSEAFSLKEAIERMEYRYIKDAYERCGNVRAAAACLSMDSSTFVRKRKKYADRYE